MTFEKLKKGLSDYHIILSKRKGKIIFQYDEDYFADKPIKEYSFSSKNEVEELYEAMEKNKMEPLFEE